ncbi:MAG: ABC transporter substrate-binding protein [Cytophagales bacterium]|nr:MAG: ABC transporter substrate-binding protein [Cytophagales bacterium]TAF60044.1 MAG: ABC transporter substrate-binding protein [Cytophagales bacterium]
MTKVLCGQKSLVLKILFVFLAVFLAACGGRTYENGTKILRICFYEDIQTLDPIYAENQTDRWLSQQIFNTLYTYGEDLVLYPELAESHSLMPNGRELQIKLREDVVFHNAPIFAEGKGRELRARDVVFSLKRFLKDAPSSSEQAALLREFLAEPIDTAIQELDHLTVKISLRQPVGAFLHLLAMPSTAIVPEEAFNTTQNIKFADQPVGTGPFMFGKYKRGSFAVLNKHPQYFKSSLNDTALPFLDAIDISFGLDEADALAELRQNGLDIMQISYSSMSKIKAEYPNELKSLYDTLAVPLLSVLGVDFQVAPLYYNDLKSPMLSQYFRKGLIKGICTDSIGLELPFDTYAKAEGQFLAPILPQYSQKATLLKPCDLAASKRLLEKYTIEPGAPLWNIYAPESHQDLAQTLQNAWHVCQFGLVNEPEKAAIKLKTKHFWVADEVLMLHFLARADSLQSFKDEVRIAWHDAAAIKEPSERQEAASLLAKQFYDKAFFMPLFFERLVFLKRKRVESMPFTPLGVWKAEVMDLDQEQAVQEES